MALLGRDVRQFFRVLERGGRLPEALAAAWSTARRGHAVIVSPAFASFDQYPNFRERAEEFHRCARLLRHRGTPSAESERRRGLIGPRVASH